MYTNDILTRLQNGESVEEIGKEFAEALNTANRLHQEEEKAKNCKEEIAGRLLNALIDYIDCVDHELADRIDVSDEDLKEIVKMMDRTIPMIKLMLQLQEEKEDDDTRMGNWFSLMGF